MELFYLKETGFKITNKVKKTSNSFSGLLTTSIELKEPTLMNSFKFINSQLPDIRYYKEPPTICERNESERMSKIQKNRDQLMTQKKELEVSQGQKDEILSRISEQREKLENINKKLSISQSAFNNNTQNLIQAIENSKNLLDINKAYKKTLEIDLESKSLNNQKILSEINELQSKLNNLISTLDSQTTLLHKTQSLILSKAAKLSFNSNCIYSLLSQSSSLHQQYQEDLEIKYKLEKEIQKFHN